MDDDAVARSGASTEGPSQRRIPFLIATTLAAEIMNMELLPRMLAPNTSIPGAPGGSGPSLAITIILSIADDDCKAVLYPPPLQAEVCGSCAPLRFDWCSDGADADCDAVDSYFECVQCEFAMFEAHLANITECAEFADEIHTEIVDGYFGEDNIFEATCGGTIDHACIDFAEIKAGDLAYELENNPYEEEEEEEEEDSDSAAGLIAAAGASIAVAAMLM